MPDEIQIYQLVGDSSNENGFPCKLHGTTTKLYELDREFIAKATDPDGRSIRSKQAAMSIGKRLFQYLFPTPADQDHFRTNFLNTRFVNNDRTTRFKTLVLSLPAKPKVMHSLPWELLCDPIDGRFVHEANIAIVRHFLSGRGQPYHSIFASWSKSVNTVDTILFVHDVPWRRPRLGEKVKRTR